MHQKPQAALFILKGSPDGEKALQWFNVTNQSILIANLCTCICVPIMDIMFSFINMRWWTTQQASFVNHSLSMLRAFSVSFSKSKMQWHAALLKNVTSVVNSIGWFQGYLIGILQCWETSYLTVNQNKVATWSYSWLTKCDPILSPQ